MDADGRDGWWTGGADDQQEASSTSEGESTHTLAANVSYLKARHEGLLVELREFVRAFAGARGRDPTEAELAADAYPSRLAEEVRRASAELMHGQASLSAAQGAERAKLDAMLYEHAKSLE